MKLHHLYKIISSYVFFKLTVHCDGFVWGDLKIALVGGLFYLSLFSIFRWWSWQLHENTIFLFINVQYQRRQTRRLYFQKRRYSISSYKTRGYYFFTRPSTAGIIRTRVLIEGWYYYQDVMNIDIKTSKP